MSKIDLHPKGDLQVDGDIIGRDQIINVLLQGPDTLPTRYDSRIRNFFEYYLGSTQQPTPFGGRTEDLKKLDAWLNSEDSCPYTFLAAPAGRGKSALLAQWVSQLIAGKRPQTGAVNVVYFPVSIRFNTNLETVVFSSLAARLAHLHGEAIGSHTDPQQSRGLFSDYLQRPRDDGGKILVVLDGLDEAAGWQAGADLFPLNAPSHLRVLVAARPLAGDKGEADWLVRLGWEHAQRAQLLQLPVLDRMGVADVLVQMGNPLQKLSTDIDLVDQLFKLSEGDPLVVRMYVEALCTDIENSPTLRPLDLLDIKPGLEGYFARWEADQHKLWGAHRPFLDKAVRGFLQLCAMALGPISKKDVLALLPDIFEDAMQVEEAAREVQRFIIGDGNDNGYVFSHPRLGIYFVEKLTAQENKSWQQRYLGHGQQTLRNLETGQLAAGEASSYIVQHYCAHLLQAGAEAQAFYDLLCEGWLRAWEWLEGSPNGFLNDIEHVRQKARAVGPGALGQQIRANLCFSSVVAIGANIPESLLVKCVESGVISPRASLVYARQKPDLGKRAHCLAVLAPLQTAIDKPNVLSEALSLCTKITSNFERNKILQAILPLLEEKRLSEVIKLIMTMKDPAARNEDLIHLLEYMKGKSRHKLISAIEKGSKIINDPSERAQAYLKLAGKVNKVEERRLLEVALDTAKLISPVIEQVNVLCKLAEQIMGPRKMIVVQEVLIVAEGISDDFVRSKLLCKVVKFADSSQQQSILQTIWNSVRVIPNLYNQVKILILLSRQLKPSESKKVVAEAFQLALTISEDMEFSMAVDKLVAQLNNKQLGDVLNKVWQDSSSYYKTSMLRSLIPYLPAKLLEKTLIIIRGTDDHVRFDLMTLLIPYFPKKKQEQLIEELLALVKFYHLNKECLKIAKFLTENQLQHLLKIIRKHDDILSRAIGLFTLASYLESPDLGMLLQEATSELMVALQGKVNLTKTKELENITKLLPKKEMRQVLAKTLAIAKKVSDEKYCSFALYELVPFLSEKEQNRTMIKALKILEDCSEIGDGAKILGMLLSRFSDESLENLLVESFVRFDDSTEIYHDPITLVITTALMNGRNRRLLAIMALTAIKNSNLSYLGDIDSAMLLYAILPLFKESVQTQILQTILKEIEKTSVIEDQAVSLAYIAQHLEQDECINLLEQAFSKVSRITSEDILISALCLVVSKSPMELVEKAIPIVRRLPSKDYQALAMSLLIPYMDEVNQQKFLVDSFKIAHTLDDEDQKIGIFLLLGPYLTEEMRNQVLTVIKRVSSEFNQLVILCSLIPFLSDRESGDVFSQVVDSLKNLSQDWNEFSDCPLWDVKLKKHSLEFLVDPDLVFDESAYLFQILQSLATDWISLSIKTGKDPFKEISDVFKAFANTPRPNFLTALIAFLPVIKEIGGQEAVEQTAQSILDCAKWWP